MSDTRFDDFTMKLVNLPVSRLISRNRTLVEAIDGFRYCQARWARSPCPAYCEADPWITSWRPLRVGASRELNSWSRSTALVVLDAGMTPRSGMRGALAEPIRRST